MANFFDPNYDPRQLSGTSGAEVSDLRPEQAYDTDMRRIPENERSAAESVNKDQGRVAKFMRAARTAGKYQQSASIAEPTIRGKVARQPASIGASGSEMGAIISHTHLIGRFLTHALIAV